MEVTALSVAIAFTLGILTTVLGGFLATRFFSSAPNENAELEEKKEQANNGSKAKGDQPGNKKKKLAKVKSVPEFSHPLLVTSLKGHAGDVTSFDISSTNKYLISTATDRSLFVWNLKDLGVAGKGIKSVRANVEYDSAHLVKFSPDNKSFIASLENGNSIRVFKIGKNEDGSLGKVQAVLDFEQTHSEEILNIGIDSAGHYVMTADTSTRFDILNLKGEKLQSVDTGTMKNSSACVSPCGRFVAVSGFTPDVKVWEVAFDKSNQFKSVKRAFDLTGHKAGVLSIAFSADSSRIATVAKDSSWKLWKADVEYARGADPTLLSTGEISEKPERAIIALSPDGKTVAIATENNISVYNGVTQQRDVEFKSVFSSEIRHLMFSMDDSGKHLFCCGDRQVKVFNNITGYKSKIDHLTKELQTCSKNVERRLTEQLQSAREALKELEG